MKRICAIIFMALTTITVLQAQTTLITGSVANERNSEGIEFATVRLMRDTTMLSGVNTDEKGNFKLRTSQQGKLILRVSCIGFKTTNLIVQLSDETPDTLNSTAKSCYTTATAASVLVGALSIFLSESVSNPKNLLIFFAFSHFGLF